MISEERMERLFREANPVPDADTFDLERPDGTAYLATLRQKGGAMTDLGPDSKPESSAKDRRGSWLGAAAAAVIVILVAVAVANQMSRRAGESTIGDAAQATVQWTNVRLDDLPAPLRIAADPTEPVEWTALASNGTVLLAGGSDTGLWRSEDGVSWTEVDFGVDASPRSIVGVEGGFIIESCVAQTQECEVWASPDALEWSTVDTAWDRSFDLVANLWLVSGPSSVVGIDPPNPEWDYREIGVVFEVGGRFVALDSATGGRWTSSDGLEWTRALAPPFSRLGESLCGIATRPDMALAVFPDAADGQYKAWSTTDGLAWQRVPFHQGGQPVSLSEPRYAGCLYAVGDLWILTPPSTSPFKSAGDVLTSANGLSWERLDLPDGLGSAPTAIRIAGDTVFLLQGSEAFVGRVTR